MIALDFTQSYFELFSLPATFVIDTSLLASNFRALQRQYHPDRFVNASDQERRVAIQSTGYINEANETLKSSRLRAHYLLEQHNINVGDADTTHDMHFLMEQMETREALEAAMQADNALDQVDHIGQQVKQAKRTLDVVFQQALEAENFIEAKEAVLKMRFYERLTDEVKRLQEILEDELFA
ncbi:MAG: Fe-S protein assembly co-chaperone HscB [Cocleimonas sp.]|nr:Fe-S protein assembly co-chaperone HscB [Cocleimonas sp.]